MSQGAAWGYNLHGELGAGIYGGPVSLPYGAVELGGDVKEVVASGGFTLGLNADGRGFGVGGSMHGELGVVSPKVLHPHALGYPVAIKQLAAGGGHTIALDANGEVWTMGGSLCGTLGNGVTGEGSETLAAERHAWSQVPVNVGLKDIIYVAAGGADCAAVDAYGHLFVWGENRKGQLGLNDQTERTRPEMVPGLAGVLTVDIGGAPTLPTHMIAAMADGTVRVWGAGENAQLGQGVMPVGSHKLANSLVPITVGGLLDIHAMDVVAGSECCYVVDDDGNVYVWGANHHYQLGLPWLALDALCPTPTLMMADVTKVASGYQFGAAIRKDELVTWGKGNRGTIGDGTLEDKAVPVVVKGISDLMELSCGEDHMVVMLRGEAPKPPLRLTALKGALKLDWDSATPLTGQWYVAIRPWREEGREQARFTQLGIRDRTIREHVFSGLTPEVIYEVAVSNQEVFKRQTMSAAPL